MNYLSQFVKKHLLGLTALLFSAIVLILLGLFIFSEDAIALFMLSMVILIGLYPIAFLQVVPPSTPRIYWISILFTFMITGLLLYLGGDIIKEEFFTGAGVELTGAIITAALIVNFERIAHDIQPVGFYSFRPQKSKIDYEEVHNLEVMSYIA